MQLSESIRNNDKMSIKDNEGSFTKLFLYLTYYRDNNVSPPSVSGNRVVNPKSHKLVQMSRFLQETKFNFEIYLFSLCQPKNVNVFSNKTGEKFHLTKIFCYVIYSILYNHRFFWVILSVLMIFLISPLFYAYNILKIMDITKPCHHLPPSTTTHHRPYLIHLHYGWWSVVVVFSNALKKIESVVTVMT